MSCSEWEKRVALEVEGDLPSQQCQRLWEHLERCPRCAGFQEELRASQALLKELRRDSLDEAELAGARLTALQKLRDQQSKSGWMDWIWPPQAAWRWPATAMLTALLLAAGWWVLQPERKNETVAEVPETPAEPQERSLARTVEPPAVDPVAPETRPELPPRSEPAENPAAGGRINPSPVDRPERRPSPSPVGAALEHSAGQESTLAEPTPAPARFELVAVPSTDAAGNESSQPAIKVASNDPDIVIYWLLDENGG